MDKYTPKHHDQAVARLADQVARFYSDQGPFRISHVSTNSTRTGSSTAPQLHIAHLNHWNPIFPWIPLDSLVSMTLGKELMPQVVMEFPGITIGDGFPGASYKSTSWKEGLFDCSVEKIKMILGDSTVVNAVEGGKNSDLFDAARCTLGTMGVVTLLKVRLTQVNDATQLVYHHTKSHPDFDFIEAIQYGMDEGVIVTGKHISSKAATAQHLPRRRFDRSHDPWFYMHARDTATSNSEIVPLQSYLFRHDRGAFWSGELLLKYFDLPNKRFFRWLLNPLMTARAIYKGMSSTAAADAAIIQDLLLPVETSEAFVEYVNAELKIWPLWICPVRKHPNAGNVPGWPFYDSRPARHAIDTIQGSHHSTATSKTRGELALNFGVWGPTNDEPAIFHKTNRGLEQKLRELRGMKVPYAANFYTEEEFWELYDWEKYDRLRKKWHAEALPTMYDKVRRKTGTASPVKDDGCDKRPMEQTWKERLWIRFLETRPFGGLYQVFHMIFR
ncbi:cell elongation protein diminuto [Paraphoma chrysanthemicola]|uniref:Cell elongation protein diminuto n=1 Tax=Paraphoma chrysanthemicola TaxID=798071 RepID=A0A8K0R0W0_9PLEO|nr:cell elongation protein diminuto [Paraphoma chrysanthemicola]